MISPEILFDLIKLNGVTYFAGVPDSLLKDFCAYVTDHAEKENHIITANEGNAIALATGWYLGSGKTTLVYMQNSGIGNAINPLLSLADPEVYSIPMLVMIGWRGEPGVKDEPQHIKQGRIMSKLLESLEFPYFILDDKSDPKFMINKACNIMYEKKTPVILLVKNGTFSQYKLQKDIKTSYSLTREEAIKCVIDQLQPSDIIISTTGKTSREIYEYREIRGEGHDNDFLTVGSMGHTLSIASGIALANPEKSIFCLDGDGSVLMHMGSLAITGQAGIKNLIHVVFNNGAHDSVGGQPTVGLNIDLPSIAKSCGYCESDSATNKSEIIHALKKYKKIEGIKLLEIKINKGARSDLGRPNISPIKNRDIFMEKLRRNDAKISSE